MPSRHRKLTLLKARAPVQLQQPVYLHRGRVQAQIITVSYNQTDLASQIVSALFFAGFFADIGAATLSAVSGRWYEMTMPEETDHVYDWVYLSENSSHSIAEEEEEEKTGLASDAPSVGISRRGGFAFRSRPVRTWPYWD